MTQIIVSAVVSFFAAILITPLLIKRFTAEGWGQEIREEGPASHFRKRGTPTMGGLAIIAAVLLGYVASGIVGWITGGPAFTASGLIVLFLMLAMGGMGFLDDWIKLHKSRNLGLNKTAKLVGQLAAAVIFGWLIVRFPNADGVTPGSVHLSFIRDIPQLNLAVGAGVVGTIVFFVFIYIVVAAWTNAVNLTDGLDGLASGVSAAVFGAYTVMTFWQYRNACGNHAGICYQVRDPLDLAVIAAASLGGCLGFLWWNAAPAKIFMGDTGSLALGGLVAGLSVTSRTELLMIVIGVLFVVEAASVVIQVAVFRTKGTRFFRMAPIHHHFENGGWAETTVVVRFWILAAVSALVGLAVFYTEWLASTGGL